MRPLILAFAVIAASANPAPAQVIPMESAQQMLDRRRAVALENQFFSLESRVATDQRLRELEVQQSRHAPPAALPPPDYVPRTSPAGLGYATIPDDRLAASNDRVRDASRNRR